MERHPTVDLVPPKLRQTAVLGVVQILMWGGSFFLLAVLARPVIEDTGWSSQWVYGALSIAMLLSGVLSPPVGRWIARRGGTALLQGSGFVLGLGLLIAAAAPSLVVFIGGWCVIGVGMAMGLYDPLFATLGRQYGLAARNAIVQVTLIAGFATTVVWPVVGFGIAQIGWRATCAAYGLVLIVGVWPLTRLSLPRDTPAHAPSTPRPLAVAPAPVSRVLFWLVAVNFTVGAVIMTVVSVQLISILQAQGLTLAAAISLSTVIGPCQVGVRFLDTVGPAKHPIWTTLLSAVLTVVGVAVWMISPATLIVGIVLYALGNGLRTILRGTLPLVLFGPASYPVVVGRLALPVLAAQALTPLVGGTVLAHYGASAMLYGLLGLSVANLAIALVLKHQIDRQPSQVAAPVAESGDHAAAGGEA